MVVPAMIWKCGCYAKRKRRKMKCGSEHRRERAVHCTATENFEVLMRT